MSGLVTVVQLPENVPQVPFVSVAESRSMRRVVVSSPAPASAPSAVVIVTEVV